MILVKKQRAELAEFKYLAEITEITEFDFFYPIVEGTIGYAFTLASSVFALTLQHSRHFA
jgi:hypothetical protein